ncbi:glyoxalase/bleomycin resistance protein/dioxygenase superfamily protein [Camelimonas lactis]|uniref:Glyoxalase/bleomycin resistance protein/dioxygenase superfamily protein n=1 Tax=Camelimonas lactis TaxID=659006 RepID=A0A4R2GK96_9HYPH|nr:glyoxalase/bleomycin resistance protein/dioxygenase superfamily protein [Camelimonas lactis]
MKVTGLNHITLAVADVERSLAFYRDVPGLNIRAVWPEGACLEVGALWLCLSQDSAARTSPYPDYTTSPSVFPGQISTISANA